MPLRSKLTSALYTDNASRFVAGIAQTIYSTASGPAIGTVNENTEPLPNWLMTAIDPLCASTMALEMGRPMPVP